MASQPIEPVVLPDVHDPSTPITDLLPPIPPLKSPNPADEQPKPSPDTGERQPQKQPQTEPLDPEKDKDAGGGD